MHFETRAIHAGQEPDPVTGAVTVPVFQTSTYEQDAIGKPRGFEYSRTGNPTRTALETAIASLENGTFGLAFASGVAASTAVLQLLRPGDHLVAGDDIYGGSYRLFERVFKPWGIQTRYANVLSVAAFQAAITERTRMIWIETPTNPLLKIADVAALAELAHAHKITLVVDNTFASPFFQRPLEGGADVVVHSTTKYLGGHSDVIGGAVVTSDPGIHQALKTYQNAAGAVPGPWDCWLVLRGIKTLAVRMREHEKNALHLARALDGHPAIDRVIYPGLPSHPQHELAKRQMTGFGGMISLELKGGFAAVERFVSRLEIFILAESLGGVESLVCYPPKMTHASFSSSERRARGVNDNLLRLSIGIESLEDIQKDLEDALARALDG